MPQSQKQIRNNRGHVRTAAIVAATLAAAGLAPLAAQASTATWTGNGSDANWGTTGNWTGGSGTGGIPASGDSLVFNTNKQLTSNDNISGLSVSGLTFENTGPFTLNSSAGYALTVTGEVSKYNIAETQTINLNLITESASGKLEIRDDGLGNLILGGSINSAAGNTNGVFLDGSTLLTLDNAGDSTSTITGTSELANTINIEAGNYTFGSVYGGGTTISQTGGTMNFGTSNGNDDELGYNATTYKLSGGAVNVTGWYRGAGNTTISGTGALTVNDDGGTAPRISTDGVNGTLTVESGGTATFDQTLQVNASGSSTNTGTINLDTGGTLTTAGLNFNSSTNGSAVINSNGGTLQFSAADAISSSTAATWNVLAGGAIIDTDGKNVTIAQALLNGGGTDGGVTKDGTGTLDLTGANTYNGNTTVNEGILQINSAYLATTSTVSIAANAVMDLNYTGTNDIASLILGGNTIGPGIYGYGQDSGLYNSFFSSSGAGTLTIPSNAVPAPATLGLVAIGGLGLLLIGRKRARKPMM